MASNLEMRTGKWRKRLLFSAVVVLVPLTVTELALRRWWPDGRYFYWSPTVQAGIAVHRNRLGFRGAEVHARRPGEFRIVCLGDSTTLGLGEAEADTWPAQLQALLDRQAPGTPATVMNAAGYGGFPHKSLHEWPRYAALDPDLILYVLCMNDVVVRRDVAVNNGAMPTTAPGEPDPWRLPRYRLAVLTSQLSWLRVVGAAKYAGRRMFPMDLPLLLRYLPDEFYTLGYGPPDQVEQAWRDTGETLTALAAAAHARGAGFVLLLIPYRFLLSTRPEDDHFGFRRDVYLLDPAPRLRAIAAAGGFPFADLTPAFQEARRRMLAGEQPYDPLFQPFDHSHPNAAGYRIIAGSVLPVAEAELRRGPLPDRGGDPPGDQPDPD